MQLEEYKFIYEDLKQQIKQLPHLQDLLRLTQKSTRKLQCINIYSITDKRDFDLQLQQQQITKQIKQLYKKIQALQQQQHEYDTIQKQQIYKEVMKNLQEIKDKNIQIFDLLNRQDQLLSIQIETVGYSIEDTNQGNFIKEEDQYEEDNMKESNNGNGDEGTFARVNILKKQIDDIGVKIMKLNGGKGKWYQTDHQDFIKIYNKCNGNGKKIIEEGVKVLGMKNTQIMDHLQLYENYLQLQKQKKIISQQYKQIKMFQKVEDEEKKQREKKQAQDKRKLKKQKEEEQNQKKREAIQKYKEKKQQQKQKMMQEQQKKQKQKILKIPIPPAKKKQILQRNQKYISQKQNNFKKVQQTNGQKNIGQISIHNRVQKSRQKFGSRSKLPSSSQNKIKKQSQNESQKNI